MKKAVLLSVLTLSCASMLLSCASGPAYADVKASGALTPHAGKGMVLIYRTPGFAASGTKPYLQANGVELSAQLARGGFFSYEASPGPLQLAHSGMSGESTQETKNRAIVGGVLTGGILGGALAVPLDIEAHRKIGMTVRVLPGHTHYVMMDRLDRPMTETPRDDAEEEITECKWLNPQTR